MFTALHLLTIAIMLMKLNGQQAGAPPSSNTMKISQWLQVGRCRSQCVNQLLLTQIDDSLIKELRNSDCSVVESCRGCWELCFNLEKDYVLWQSVCLKRELCRPSVKDGCRVACNFKYNLTDIQAGQSARVLDDIPKVIDKMLIFTVSHLNQVVLQFEFNQKQVDVSSWIPIFWVSMKHRFSDEWTSVTQSISNRVEVDWNEAVSSSLYVFRVLVVRENGGVVGRSDECDFYGCPGTMSTPRSESHSSQLSNVVVIVTATSSFCVVAVLVAVVIFVLKSRRPKIQLIRQASIRRVRSVKDWARRSMRKRNADEAETDYVREQANGTIELADEETPPRDTRTPEREASGLVSIEIASSPEIYEKKLLESESSSSV